MDSRSPGFRGEYLWELDIPQTQLLALAAAFPEEKYGWRPADGARSFSEVLVHVAAGNFMLLRLVGVRAPSGLDLYGSLEGGQLAQFAAAIRKNIALEKTVTEKRAVIDLLGRSFEAVRQSFMASSDEEIEMSGHFFGEPTTVRRVYLRMLAHTHEHMGQTIAYARASGIKVPWPDPLQELDRMTADASSS
jgi:uncharacterized damage-inducible protein DinB